jgi:archaeosine synthase
VVKTCKEKPTAKKSLENLLKTLKKEVKKYEKISSQKRKLEDIFGLAYYQFGKELAEKLLKNSNIKGKYPYQKIISDGKQLGMMVKERGFISLTLDGGNRIKNSGKYWVEIYDDFALKGSVFAPGLKDCDKNIRIGDEVVVLRNKKLCGVGVAMMNGEEMKQVNYGEAIKVRHHI